MFEQTVDDRIEVFKRLVKQRLHSALVAGGINSDAHLQVVFTEANKLSLSERARSTNSSNQAAPCALPRDPQPRVFVQVLLLIASEEQHVRVLHASLTGAVRCQT